MRMTVETISAHELLTGTQLSLSALEPDPGIELPRAEGMHLSTVLKDLGTSAGLIKPFADSNAAEEDVELGVDTSTLRSGKKVWIVNWMMLMGLAWESWLFRRIPGVVWQPGETECDGIFMNPDGIQTDLIWRGDGPYKGQLVEAALHECKVTWQSINTTNDDIGWYRKAQTMGYCKGLGLWDLDAGKPAFVVLWMIHVNGNYRDQRFAQLRRYWIEYTAAEINGLWMNVIRHAAKMRSEGKVW